MTQDQSYADIDAEQRRQVIETLVSIRKALGISQSEVGRRMGVSQATVSQYEVMGRDPFFASLQRYARALGVEVVAKVEWMCPECNDVFDQLDPDCDDDVPPMCGMCRKANQ